jgi:hypothetical protein
LKESDFQDLLQENQQLMERNDLLSNRNNDDILAKKEGQIKELLLSNSKLTEDVNYLLQTTGKYEQDQRKMMKIIEDLKSMRNESKQMFFQKSNSSSNKTIRLLNENEQQWETNKTISSEEIYNSTNLFIHSNLFSSWYCEWEECIPRLNNSLGSCMN